MRRSSLRTWLLLVAILFATLVVGGVALTTYVVVSDGMSVVAHDATARIARDAARIARDATTAAKLEAAAAGLEGEAREREAEREFLRSVPDLFSAGGVSEGEFAFYNENLEPIWFSDERALIEDVDEQRRRAMELNQVTESTVDEGGILQGLVGPAQLGVYVVHVPLDLPADTEGLLEVAYFPAQEEMVIDSIRLPMFTLAVSAMFIMVVMMQTSMGWVLKLVDDLRKAADSVDAGRLDVHLPAEGEHEIGDLARSLNALIDRLRRRANAQTRFVADASHELATPVAGIRGYTNILKAWGAEDPEVREEAIAAIDRESRRMARLTSDLLALVRDEGALQFKSVRFDVNARCRETLAAAANRYIGKNLEFIGPSEGQLVMVGDPERVEDVISILVDNAAKYTPPGGTVAVSTRRRRDTIVIEVSDTGVGIPAEDLPSIFERFYRSDTSRSKETGGFGLGLPIAKSIAEGAGGDIEVRSVLGEGSTFTITLPRGQL